jgi:inosine-uridine nucleoside N-ribohydrolase
MRRSRIPVDTRGALTAGMVVADLHRGSQATPTADVCVEVAAERFLQRLVERVLQQRFGSSTVRRFQ